MENIRGNNDTLAATITLTEEAAEKNYNEIWVETLGPLRADTIFDDLSRESDKNHVTLAKKVRESSCSKFSKKAIAPTAA